MSQYKPAPIAIITGLIVIMAFQNCSGYKSKEADSAGSAGGDPVICMVDCDPDDPNTPPPNPNDKFQAGATFNPDLLPYPPQGSLVSEVDDYLELDGQKALAMAANGYGFISNHPGIITQAEASRLALEACQVVAGDKPCAILAEGDKYKYSESVFKTSMRKVLEKGARTFDPLKVPFQRDAVRANQMTVYAMASAPFKALAIDLKGGGAARYSTISQADATRRALEGCEGYSRGRVCTLYAKGNDVLFNVTTMNFNTTPSLDYSVTNFSPNEVPFVDDPSRKVLKDYVEYAKAVPYAALAIHPNGGWAYHSTPGNALASCQALAGTTSQCVLYAQKLKVDFKKTHLQREF